MSLRFSIFSPYEVELAAMEDSQAAFDLFHLVWQSTFQSLFGDNHRLYSDDFSRQNYIQALFEGRTCISLNLIRKVDLRSPVTRQDSWFADWPESTYQELATAHRFALVNSYFTVHPNYRKTLVGQNLHPSYLQGCLSVLDQVDEGHSLQLGMMRNDRSMNVLGERWGSRTLCTVLHNDIDTAIVTFDEAHVRRASRTFPSIVFDLLKNKTDFRKGVTDDRRQRAS